MNVEQAREVFHAVHENPFATFEQLQMPHTTLCQTVKVSWQVLQAGWSLFVYFVYVVPEAESLMFGGF